MKPLSIRVTGLALCLAFSAGAMAQGISRDEYKAGKDKIEAEYKAAKAACAPLSGNQKDICQAEAKGKERVGLAELEGSYKPTPKNRYEARATKAEADYAVEREKCDDRSGDAKAICVKEAKAMETSAKADARAQMKSLEAGKESAEARNKATAEKRDAQYEVAKEKCDTYTGDAKERCIEQAKAHFGK